MLLGRRGIDADDARAANRSSDHECGHPDSAETKALLAAAHAAPEPVLIVTVIADAATLPPGHPAQGKAKVQGRATAYVCRGPVCEAPVTDPADLTAALV